MSTPSIPPIPSIHFFLVTPKDKANYKEMVVYSDSIEEARKRANEQFILLRSMTSSVSTMPQVNDVYLNESTSTCVEIFPKIIISDYKYAHISHKGVEYHLPKNHPKRT